MAGYHVIHSPERIRFTEAETEALNQIDPDATLERPTEDDIFYSPEPSDVYHFHGAVDVPGAKQPVKYTVAVPANLSSELVSIWVPGLGATKKTSRKCRDFLAGNEGIIAVSYEPVRLDDPYDNPQEIHKNTIGSIANDLPDNPGRLDVPNGDAVNDAKLALILHSMGTLPGTEWALENPDMVAMVVYVGGLGLEKSSLAKLVRATPVELIRDIFPAILQGKFGYNPDLLKRSSDYFLTNLRRTKDEIISCFSADEAAAVFVLHELKILQTVICMENDSYFKPDKSLAAISHLVDNFLVMAGSGHTAPQTESERSAAVIGREIRLLAAPVTSWL